MDAKQTESHVSLVHGVVGEMIHSERFKHNVLCHGLWQAKSADINGVDGMAGIECAWPNSALNIIRGRSWELLHQRIGSQMLRYLLRETAVFARLPNNCYLQLCGTRLGTLIKQVGGRRDTAHLAAKLLLANKSHSQALSTLPTQSIPLDEQQQGGFRRGNSDGKSLSDAGSTLSLSSSLSSTATLVTSSPSLPGVHRTRIFYDERFVRKIGFDTGHILCDPQCQPRRKFARTLVRSVFALSGTWKIPKHFRTLIGPLCKLVRNHANLRYGFWLKLHCPLVSFERAPAANNEAAPDELTLEDVLGPGQKSYRELIASYTADRLVCKFVGACVYRLVPGSIWGCGENISLMRAMVDEFVRARRYEEFQVDKWCNRWKTSPCKWLPRNAPAKSRHMVRLWCRWLMNELVIPLLRNHFYVTESATHRNKVFYYRKPLWRKILAAELGDVPKNREHVLKDMFRSLPSNKWEELLNNRFNLPCARLRLQPKATSMRPIVNLSSRGHSGGDSANFLLRPAFEALRWELLQNGKAHLLGSSVFNLNEAYHKLLPFILWKRRNPQRPLYFVSVDVKQSFDSVNQSKLCSILFENPEPVFEQERYVLQRYSVHLPCVGHIATATKQVVTPESQIQPLNLSLREFLSTSRTPRNSVLVDSASHDLVERSTVEAMLRHHITSNLIQVGNAYYLQEVGISQGSVLSSMLCSLFYGDMEIHGLADLFSFTQQDGPEVENSMLVRLIDDNLFVTTSPTVALEFLSRLNSRFVTEYGTQLNPGKTLVNFPCFVPGRTRPMPEVQRHPSYPSENPCLPWCGVLIDTCTFEIFGDYSRYRGAYMNESLTVSLADHPGVSLRQKIKQFAQPKCIPLLLDCRINRPHIVLLNVYQIFLLCAMKFHCHVLYLPQHSNQRFLFDVIVDVVEYANALIQSRMREHGCGGDDDVLPRDVRYLGRHAFFVILSKKHHWYPEVLQVLKEQVFRDSYYHGCRSKLAQVVDPQKTTQFYSGILF